MKGLIIIFGLAIIASKSQAQQNVTSNDINHYGGTSLNTAQLADSIKSKIAADFNKQGLNHSSTEKYGDHMPIVHLKKEDKMPVYYAETNDKMPIKYYKLLKNDSVKNNFFVPVQIPKIDFPTPAKVTVK